MRVAGWRRPRDRPDRGGEAGQRPQAAGALRPPQDRLDRGGGGGDAQRTGRARDLRPHLSAGHRFDRDRDALLPPDPREIARLGEGPGGPRGAGRHGLVHRPALGRPGRRHHGRGGSSDHPVRLDPGGALVPRAGPPGPGVRPGRLGRAHGGGRGPGRGHELRGVRPGLAGVRAVDAVRTGRLDRRRGAAPAGTDPGVDGRGGGGRRDRVPAAARAHRRSAARFPQRGRTGRGGAGHRSTGRRFRLPPGAVASRLQPGADKSGRIPGVRR